MLKLQVILKALSEVCPSASVAVTVNDEVVAEVCAVCVPVIVQLPTPVVNVIPATIGEGETVKDIASVHVKDCVAIAAVPEKVPKDPAAVTHAGASLTFKSAESDLPDNPVVTLVTLR